MCIIKVLVWLWNYTIITHQLITACIVTVLGYKYKKQKVNGTMSAC